MVYTWRGEWCVDDLLMARTDGNDVEGLVGGGGVSGDLCLILITNAKRYIVCQC